MPAARENTQKGYSSGERLRHSLVLLILLDLLTLGLYSMARLYLLHTTLAKKTGHRPFSSAFLHILVVLNLLFWVLRFTRESVPGDLAVIMTQLGAGLLGITVLLIFRRALRHEFQLRIQAFPLALFGFWSLQYAINRGQGKAPAPSRVKDSWPALAAVILLAVSLFVARGTLRHFLITDASMEPSLIAGDYVLAEQLSLALGSRPQRGDLMVHPAPPPERGQKVRRVLGLPGDRLGFLGDRVFINGQALLCLAADEPGESSIKHFTVCEIEGHSFTLQRYRAGAAVQGEFEVPADHYFMIGDNFDLSVDSRRHGSIPARSILGRVRWRTVSYRVGESIPWKRWLHSL